MPNTALPEEEPCVSLARGGAQRLARASLRWSVMWGSSIVFYDSLFWILLLMTPDILIPFHRYITTDVTISALPCLFWNITCTHTNEGDEILHRNLVFDLDPRSQAHFIDKLALMIGLILLRLRRSLVRSSPEEELSDLPVQACVDLLCLRELHRVLWQPVLNIVADDDKNTGCIPSINCTDVTNSALPCLLWNIICAHANEINK